MWYLKRGVLLTKDNLARLNWIGSKVCSFCNREETIQHLFFDCAYAKFFWRAIHLVFGLAPPKNVDDLFNHWLKQGVINQNYIYWQAYRLCVGWFGSPGMMLFLTYVNQKLFFRFYSGNVLAMLLGTVAAQWGTKGEIDSDISFLEMLDLRFFASHEWLFSLRIDFQ